MPAINYMNLNTLVTASEVRSATFTNSNTDLSLIKEQVIRLAEIAHIRDVIGHDFYDFLKVEMDKANLDRCWNTTPATCDSCQIDTESSYQVLMDSYLKPALCWFVKFEVINDMQYNSTSAGVVMNMPEFTQPVGTKELNAYKQDVYRKAKLLLDAMVEFLNDSDNDGCFPEYDIADTDGDGYDCDSNCSSGVATKNHGMIIY